MSDTLASLQHKIDSATDLQSVVRSMKALAASSIGQYERSVHALADYQRAVELGLAACFRNAEPAVPVPATATDGLRAAVVFGSDQGLVGQFNEVVAEYAMKALVDHQGESVIWAVGERVHARLSEGGFAPVGLFNVPNSINAITSLVGQIQISSEAYRDRSEYAHLYVFHNRPQPGALYEPVSQRLLPLDARWQQDLARLPWPSGNLPEVIGGVHGTLPTLIREYLFVALFRACAESLTSENATRLAAMERAGRNIDDLLESLHGTHHRLRQSRIDEELFDVISGSEGLIMRKIQ
jgi:F-type H+-transporting ATPase subunit gamma